MNKLKCLNSLMLQITLSMISITQSIQFFISKISTIYSIYYMFPNASFFTAYPGGVIN